MVLKDFKNKHSKETAYIIGPGNSLNFYPENFYNLMAGHITIGMSRALLCPHIKKADYWIGVDYGHREKPLLINMRDNLSYSETLNFFTPYEPEIKNINRVEFHNYSGSDIDVFFDKNPIEQDGLCTESSLKAAITLAAYMGITTINLIGIDCGLYENEGYWDGEKDIVDRDARALKRYTDQVFAIKEISDKVIRCGININRIMPIKGGSHGKV